MEYRKIQPREVGGEVIAEPSKKKRKVYPKIDIPLSALPEAEKWPVGDTYEIALKLKMTELRMNKREKEEGMSEYNNNAGFDVIGVHVMPTKKPKHYSRMG